VECARDLQDFAEEGFCAAAAVLVPTVTCALTALAVSQGEPVAMAACIPVAAMTLPGAAAILITGGNNEDTDWEIGTGHTDLTQNPDYCYDENGEPKLDEYGCYFDDHDTGIGNMIDGSFDFNDIWEFFTACPMHHFDCIGCVLDRLFSGDVGGALMEALLVSFERFLVLFDSLIYLLTCGIQVESIKSMIELPQTLQPEPINPMN
jgi:hypothetical protein